MKTYFVRILNFRDSLQIKGDAIVLTATHTVITAGADIVASIPNEKVIYAVEDKAIAKAIGLSAPQEPNA